jgi:uncharacterized protein YyaL (SSP411 family)
MISLDYLLSSTYEVIIVGNKEKKDTQKIIQNINSEYLPNKVIILKEPKEKNTIIEELVPYIKQYNQIKNQATIYVCKNQQCQQPTTDIEKIKQLLN